MISNYYKYYKEIKNRTFLVLITWLSCLSMSYAYKEAILFTIISSNNIFIGIMDKPYFIFTNVTEIFYLYLELTLFISNQISLIGILYQILMFLSLGLYKIELKKLKTGFQVFTFSWLFSITMLYYVIIRFSDVYLSMYVFLDIYRYNTFFL